MQALDCKYDTQKAIIMKMEEHLLELYKNPATCPPSELLRSGKYSWSIKYPLIISFLMQQLYNIFS